MFALTFTACDDSTSTVSVDEKEQVNQEKKSDDSEKKDVTKDDEKKDDGKSYDVEKKDDKKKDGGQTPNLDSLFKNNPQLDSIMAFFRQSSSRRIRNFFRPKPRKPRIFRDFLFQLLREAKQAAFATSLQLAIMRKLKFSVQRHPNQVSDFAFQMREIHGMER